MMDLRAVHDAVRTKNMASVVRLYYLENGLKKKEEREKARDAADVQPLTPPRGNSINMLDKLKRELVPAAGDKLVLKLSPPPPPLADKQACACAHVTMRSHLQDACGVKDDVKAAPKPAVDTAKPDGDVDEIYLSSPPSHLGAEACGIKSAAAEELAAKSAAAEEDAESATEEATAEEAATKKATTEEAAAKSATEEESEEAATEEAAAEESATEAVAQHEAKNEKNKAPTKAEKKDCAAGVRVNSINIMAENKTAGKVGIMPADVFSAPPLGAKAACDKNDVVKGVPEAKSGAEASLDESTLKKDPAAEKDPAADKVDSDKAKAMSSAHAPSAVFWSKLDPPTSPNGTKEAPALKPVTEDAPAFKPVTAGGAPLPSIKEFPAEEPAPSGIADWTTPSNPRRKTRRKNGRKGASAPIVRTKSTPVGGSNGFGCLLGTDGNEGILGGNGKATGGSTPSTTDSGATANVETTTITTPEGSVSASGWFSWPKFCPSYLLRLFGILALLCLGTAFALSSYSATSALLSSQRYESPWPTSPPATFAKSFTPAELDDEAYARRSIDTLRMFAYMVNSIPIPQETSDLETTAAPSLQNACGECVACKTPYGYGINEACTISGVPPVELEVIGFDVDGTLCAEILCRQCGSCGCDYLTVNGVKYCGTSGPSGAVAVDGVIEWFSNGYIGVAASTSIYLPPGAHFELGSEIHQHSISCVSNINVTVASSGEGATLDGRGQTGLFYLSGGCSLTLRGLTLVNGRVDGRMDGGGGVVHAYGAGDVEIIDSTVRDCSAGEYGDGGGGVVYAEGSGAVSIIGSTVSGCSARYGGGGVIYADGSGAVSIIGSTVSGCSARVRRVELAACSGVRQRGER
ncbi:hypothetical protein EMIHUDRAFT_200377 [Emiliania huxleyi CCMP1516]|uniref:Right handed beta helix domain-containing protein n=2 Tax=Emiliania huxleyi TaxID=2903 RepID=A0A0D3KQG9_EMIH1|nr:hypothetical protein EMIHUDRAFT_200377 [Emiliania huxleyi CCMP1516]EOD38004.1 hypothetical protein EMIHUDRAFT_200377 [Emiliania huxleyi CCMP1516]|eukprot:XP_005790433.1 hypothetical protein EMIHUDRAFT_200377 [Emiliania huxleyi CCMP1516]